MGYKKIIKIITAASFGLMIIDVGMILYAFSHFYQAEDLCYKYFIDSLCYGYTDRVLQPIFLASLLFFIPSFILLFCKQAVIKSWLMFTVFSLPIYAFLLYLFASSGGGPDSFMSAGYGSIPGEVLVMGLSIIYLFISLLIIIKSIRLAGKSEMAKNSV